MDFLYAKFEICSMEKNLVLVEFGKRIRELRLENGWSQEELSFKSGFHRTYIGMIERAERNISLKNIQRFAETFEVKIEDFFKEK